MILPSGNRIGDRGHKLDVRLLRLLREFFRWRVPDFRRTTGDRGATEVPGETAAGPDASESEALELDRYETSEMRGEVAWVFANEMSKGAKSGDTISIAVYIDVIIQLKSARGRSKKPI
jgi:hypothetical protein